eukprot:gene50405-68524_t
MPASSAALSAARPSASETSPQEPPICHAPKPMSLTVNSVRPNVRCLIFCLPKTAVPANTWCAKQQGSTFVVIRRPLPHEMADEKIRKLERPTAMGKMIRKSEIPTKICPVCVRPFAWRKKWERDWDS